MFFFFFDELYYIPEIEKAFKNVCLDKMLLDGYFDMSVYISGIISKNEMLSKLEVCKSRYDVLYKHSFPKKDNAAELWRQYFNNNEIAYNDVELSGIESVAIVNWVYKAFDNKSDREEFTRELLKNIKDFHKISNNIRFSRGVVYNEEKVEINFVSSISKLYSLISAYKNPGNQMFFRGQSNANYILLPSVMRSNHLKKKEKDMYNELIVECPADFENCHIHLEKLVKMQHYGLPTRLLDITRNPLVALYFACEREFDFYGEVVLFTTDVNNIKYPQSDTVSILASLPLFSYDEQMEFYDLAINTSIDKKTFNQRVPRLLHAVRLEKPAFKAEMEKEHLVSNFIVYALKNNNRIVKQDGAFIICGLQDHSIDHSNSLNQLRYEEKGKKSILLIEKKKQLIEELDNYSINHATLFPEIECVSKYIKDKYS
jgi:hypothetical protein